MSTTSDPSLWVSDPVCLPRTKYQVVRKQKIVLKPKNLILSNEELSHVREGVEYQLNTRDVIFVPEGFDVYIVDQDYVIKEN